MRLYLLISVISTITYGQVVVNEIVLDPQNDWSGPATTITTIGFNGNIHSDVVSKGDQYIELYISKDSLDLSTWHIKIDDSGTPKEGTLVEGDLFAGTTYFSNTGGTFTNTKAGDYIVLGDPSGNMEIVFNITLRDSVNGTLIDSVALGGDSGNPDGSADSTGNEALLRYPDGCDLINDDPCEFKKGTATPGDSNDNTILGVKRIKYGEDFTYYPNPFRDFVTFRTRNDRIKLVLFYNVIGKLVLKSRVSTNINTTRLRSGVYIVKVIDTQGRVGVCRLLKR